MAQAEQMDNIVKVKVNDAVDMLLPMVANGNPEEVPSLMMYGGPGIGKSAVPKTLAQKLRELTEKTVNVTDVRLLNFNPVDLRGIPSKSKSKIKTKRTHDSHGNKLEKDKDGCIEEEVAKWLKPQIFQMDDSDDVINLLFLDEITAATPNVQASAYQIVLDRVIGEHRLPDNCFVIAAGNRTTDKSVAYAMPKALANRFTNIEIICDVGDWKKWAIPKGVEARVVGYINYKNSALYDFNPSSDNVAFPSPRSWEMVDKHLKLVKDVDKAFPLIAGSIGMGAAIEFKSYCQVYHKLPDIKAIYDGIETTVPQEPDVLYALSSALVSNCLKANTKQLSNLLTYTMTMPAEFATLTVRDIILIEKMVSKVLTLPEWIEWSKRYKNHIM